MCKLVYSRVHFQNSWLKMLPAWLFCLVFEVCLLSLYGIKQQKDIAYSWEGEKSETRILMDHAPPAALKAPPGLCLTSAGFPEVLGGLGVHLHHSSPRPSCTHLLRTPSWLLRDLLKLPVGPSIFTNFCKCSAEI